MSPLEIYSIRNLVAHETTALQAWAPEEGPAGAIRYRSKCLKIHTDYEMMYIVYINNPSRVKNKTLLSASGGEITLAPCVPGVLGIHIHVLGVCS